MKNIILGIYLVLVLIGIHYFIHPDIEILGMCAMLAFVKVAMNLILGFDLSDTVFVWIKALILFCLTGLTVYIVYLSMSSGAVSSLSKSISSIQAVAWTIFLSMAGIDLHFLYSYTLEAKLEGIK